ncbi:MAG: nitrous oxide-stimulated promoter family protein, partial [Candidatus Heimdallarchaeota archaeon]|nr:nitrous oxide-stimulated promoter family protein [Candidatus Heimdallarchaeota archaeon]
MALEKVENENTPVHGNDNEPLIIKREKKMVEFMVQIYCKGNHKTRGALCLECNEFLEYVKERLDRCPYQEGKTGCGRCGLPC